MGPIIQYAEEALAQTPEQLPVLKKGRCSGCRRAGTGVHPEGGCGRSLPGRAWCPVLPVDTAAAPAEEAATVVNAAGEVEEVDINNPYCTEFLVMRDDPKA